MTDKNLQQFTFKAETKQLLNILIHSLYKDREVFLRELLSNASDALNRLRFEMVTNQNVLDGAAELKIHITADKDSRTLTIQDTGIGMTRDEVIENLGTIAQSGARKFLDAAKDKTADFVQVIGQFGVGFYSVFMVAESVRVTSRSFDPQAEAVTWFATGDDSYEISAAEMTERGTKIEIKLKEDAAEFAEEYRIKNIIHKHSDYIGFPIYVGEGKEAVNKQTSLWRTSKQEVTEEQYKEFYRQTTLDFEEPLTHIHMSTDAPVQLYALLFLPSKAERGVFSLRKDDGLKLYSRNILIDEYNKDLLPEYLRFVQGVVDSEDLPLNVSRETVQSSGLMPKLKKVITNQVIKELENLAKNNAEKYHQFWQEFGVYLKQGVAAAPADADSINPLLRFKTNLNPEAWSSLEEYVSRMKEGQKEIFYIVGEDPQVCAAQSAFGLLPFARHGSVAADRPDGFVHADGVAQVQRLRIEECFASRSGFERKAKRGSRSAENPRSRFRRAGGTIQKSTGRARDRCSREQQVVSISGAPGGCRRERQPRTPAGLQISRTGI